MKAQETLDNGFGDMYSELKVLSDLADKLEEQRKKDGSIEFNSVEVKFKLDKNKFPIGIYIKPHVRTMEIIEEFMLLDNKRVSMRASLDSKGAVTKNPFIYRIHDKPKAEKVKKAVDFLKKIGYDVDVNGDGSLSSQEINKANRFFKGTDKESIVSITLLRSMEKAKYETTAKGHFGLAFKYYSHFTSPIRRYPDFIAHRLLRRYLAGEKVPQSEVKQIAADAKHSSEMEVKAVDAERATISFKYAEYYSKRIGEKFNGIVTGIKKFGIFVENMETRAQGLIPTRDIADDYFKYDEGNMTLTGERTGHQFKLGQRITAEVVKVDLNMKAIDLKFTGKIETKKSKKILTKI
ncbi:MAG TPA: RNB domain-containing ribonuclease [Candidatus Pacebacteria bacterium]|nr:RNB domain-containing ribonuclease [Candidatus Paceibacterota bacterium]